jgi:DNA-binding MarR family transcriptional regulator
VLTAAVVFHGNHGTVQRVSMSTTSAPQIVEGDELIDAVLSASRVLVAVAARSLAGLVEDVTLAQYRVLVELAARGPQRVADLATVLDVERSTATRMCDRLVRKHLIYRRRVNADRRAVRVALAPSGRELIALVSDRRREEVTRILRRMPSASRGAVLSALRSFAAAAGEVPEQDWSLGWHLTEVGTAKRPATARR